MRIHVKENILFGNVSFVNSIFEQDIYRWQQVPQVSIAQTYLKIMNKCCEQFGLTPSARSRIVADIAEDKESDEMELLLIKGGGR